MTALPITANRNPFTGKLQGAFSLDDALYITGTGFGDGPTVEVYQDWRGETIGQRAVKGVWDTALYGATDADSYPLFGSLGGVTGICSRDNTNIDFDITAADSTDYRITISGVQYSINSGVSATQTSITTALKAAINADSGCPAVAGGTTYLSLTRKNSAVPYTIIELNATSTSSIAIGTGSKSFTITETGKTFSVGQIVGIVYTTNQANTMSGTITAFDSGTGAMTVNVTSVSGSGTYTNWLISGTDTVAESPSAGKNIINRNNSLTGFIKTISPAKSYFVAWQAGTPDGYYFPGAIVEQTFPEASTEKMCWVSNGGLDSPKKADIVSLSRSSSSTWQFVGNQSNVNIYHGGAYSWNKPNSYFAYHKAGASPFTDLGTAISAIATDAGTTTASQTDKALFRKISTLTITVQNSANYIVTVNGTPCTTYTSDGSAATAEIQAGVIAAINGSTSAVVASATDSTVVCTAADGTNPTVTATANILVEDLDPWVDQISTIWHGNKNQANTNTIYPMLYWATGDNCGNQICIADSSSFSSATKRIFLKPVVFNDTTILAYSTAAQRIGMTHWQRFKDGVFVESGAL